MKVTFFGSSNFAIPILEGLSKHYEIEMVVTMPDQPVGRQKTLTPTPIGALAQELNFPLYKPETLKTTEAIEKLRGLTSEIFIVAAYGKIIPGNVLNLPSLGCLNLHPSLLPLLRGPSPIQTAILHDFKTTGTTLMKMDEELDHGPILAQAETNIESDDSFLLLQERLARLSTNLLLDNMPAYASGNLIPKEQDHSKATTCKILTRDDARVDWTKNARDIYNQFRAFYPWPGLWTTLNGKILKIRDCIATDFLDEDQPGKILMNGMVVCGNRTALQLLTVQLEGKTETKIKDFLLGNRLDNLRLQ